MAAVVRQPILNSRYGAAVVLVIGGVEGDGGAGEGEELADVVGDACAVELEDRLFLRPQHGKGPLWVLGLLHLCHLVVVHGVAQEAGRGVDEAFHIDADGLVVNYHGDGVLAVADVEMNVGEVGEERLAVLIKLIIDN